MKSVTGPDPRGAGAELVLPSWSSIVTGSCSSGRQPLALGSLLKTCLARDKNFKALGKDLETPPKFAENISQAGGSLRVNKQLRLHLAWADSVPDAL